MAHPIAFLSRVLNLVRLWRLPAHRRRVRQSRRLLRRLRAFDGPHAAARTVGYLRKVDPLVIEELVLTAFESRGHLVLRNRRYTGDQGIDGWVRLSEYGWVPLQCKRFSGHVDNRDVQALRLLVERRRLEAGLFVHTGVTASASYRHLAGGRLILVSGDRLVRLVRGEPVDLRLRSRPAQGMET